MERRKFIKNAALAGSAAVMLPAALDGCNPSGKERANMNYVPVSGTKKPLAIAMWDYTWILRHHRYGEFYDWDKVLEGLAERGYNAIRMDAMPQFVVSGKDGKIIEEFRSVAGDLRKIGQNRAQMFAHRIFGGWQVTGGDRIHDRLMLFDKCADGKSLYA